MLFQKGEIVVCKLKMSDKHHLSKWLSDPKVLEFYEGRDNPFDLERVTEKFFNRSDHVVRCMVKFCEKAIGYFQYYPLDDELKAFYTYESGIIYGMDQFIGEVAYWDQGIGTLLVESAIDYLTKELHANKIVMDPQTWNKRAIHCYEKCGFQKVKLLPQHEFHEGEYRDCWLMEYNKEGVAHDFSNH